MSGDYLLAQALKNILNILDNFELTAGNLLDKTFDNLQQQQRDFFLNIEALLDTATENSQGIMERVSGISDQAYSIMNDLPLVGKNRYTILRYSPSLIVWEGNREIRFRVVGLSMGQARPILKIGDNEYSPISLTNQEAIFSIATDYIRQPFDDYVTVSATIDMHEHHWLGDKTYSFPIDIQYAPRIFGKVERVQIVGEKSVRERSATFRRDVTFEGRDRTVRIAQNPTGGEDWRIDPGSIVYKKTSGKASDPLYMDGPASPTGFTMAMQCLQYYQDLGTKPGYGTAWWTWQEVRTVKHANVTSSVGGERYVSLGNVVVWPLMQDVKSLSGVFETFPGQKTYINGVSPPSSLVKVTLDGQNIIISPKYQQNSLPRTSGRPYEPNLTEMFNEARRQDLTNIHKFLGAAQKIIADAKDQVGEEMFKDIPSLPAGGFGAGKPSTYAAVEAQLDAVRSLVVEVETPILDQKSKYALYSHVSIMLNRAPFRAQLEKILLWADSR